MVEKWLRVSTHPINVFFKCFLLKSFVWRDLRFENYYYVLRITKLNEAVEPQTKKQALEVETSATVQIVILQRGWLLLSIGSSSHHTSGMKIGMFGRWWILEHIKVEQIV